MAADEREVGIKIQAKSSSAGVFEIFFLVNGKRKKKNEFTTSFMRLSAGYCGISSGNTGEYTPS
jgi:hypothetical protein